MKTALIAGSTGLTGRQCLYQLLESDLYAKVIALVRKPLNLKNPKLQEVMVDFDHLEKYTDLMKADHIYCCIGTTIGKAGSKENFRKTDYGYNLSVAKICLDSGASKLMLVSALGADKHSGIFYNQVKGELEASLSKLNYEAVHFFRPSLLLGYRKEFRATELISKYVMRILGFLFIGPLRKYKAIQAEQVAKSMVKAAASEEQGVVIHPNEEMLST